MGDYRNELQSALSQVEALRAENASLRVKLRVSQTTGAPTPGEFPPLDGPAPGEAPSQTASGPSARAPSTRRQRVIVGASVVAACAALMAFVSTRRGPAEERLLLPNLPEVPSAGGPASPLPLLPTSVRLTPSRDEAQIVEVYDDVPFSLHVGMGPVNHDRLRWPADTRQGLYVLHTMIPARCSVGGVLFDAPSAVFVTAGSHTVRCQVGNVRHVWTVTITGRGITLDTQHAFRAP